MVVSVGTCWPSNTDRADPRRLGATLHSRQSLLQIAGELKDHCGLDDSNVWTARGRQAEVLADEH